MPWRDTRIWYDLDTWSEVDLVGDPLTESVVATPAEQPDIVGGLSDRLKSVEAKTEHNQQPGMTDTFLTAIPAGFMLLYVAANNKTANTAVLSCGFSTDTADLFAGQTIPQGATLFTLIKLFSFDTATDISINASQGGDGWNGAEIDFYFITKKI